MMSYLLVEMQCLLCCTCYRLSGLSANAHKLIYLFNWVLIHYAHNFVCKFILLIRWWSWMSARVWCYKMAPGHWHSLSHSGEDANELCSLEMQKLWAFDFEESCARWIMCFWWLFDCEMESFNFWCQVIGTFLNRCNIFVQLCYGVSRLLKSDALMDRTSVRLHPSVRFCMHSLFRCDPVCCTFQLNVTARCVRKFAQ